MAFFGLTVLLWPVESPGFDTLIRAEEPPLGLLWPVESPGFDTLCGSGPGEALGYGLSRVPASIH